MLFISNTASQGAFAQLLRGAAMDRLATTPASVGSHDGEIARCTVFVALIDQDWIRSPAAKRDSAALKNRLHAGTGPRVICVFFNTTAANLPQEMNISINATPFRAGSKRDALLCEDIIKCAQSARTYTQTASASALNLLLIGDSGSGKTSLMHRAASNTYKDNLPASVGVEHQRVSVSISDNRPTDLTVWDSAGQDRLETIAATFFRRAHGVMVCYSVDDATSFAQVSRWLDRFEAFAPDGTPWLLVGNKADLPTREITAEHIAQVTSSHPSCAGQVEVSALSGQGVSEAFKILAESMVARQRSLTASRTSYASMSESFSLSHTSNSNASGASAVSQPKKSFFSCSLV